LDPTEQVLPEDGDRIQFPKRCVFKEKRDGVLNKDKTMGNVQKRNICRILSVFSENDLSKNTGSDYIVSPLTVL
jgi:hypothetical protein